MNEQEQLWHGVFGDEYHARNAADPVAATLFMRRAVRRAPRIASAIEFGAGNGVNLSALKRLVPHLETCAVEVNESAALSTNADRVYRRSILECDTEWIEGTYDLAMTKGLLIHIAPDDLEKAYRVLHRAARRYVLLAEYYSPHPRMIPYRGHDNALWARDFAGEFMTQHPDCELIDYGFFYRGDRICKQDDVTWFLMEKRA